MDGSRILVTGLPKGTNKSDLIIYFQSARDSGGGDVRKIEIEGKQAIVTFEDVKAASRIVNGRRNHCFKGQRVFVSLIQDEVKSSPEDELEDTLISEQVSDARRGLQNYRANPLLASKNGNKGAQSWAEQDPTTEDSPREGCLPQQCTVKVTGLLADTSKDLLTNYFENRRRSNGGPICDIEIDRDLRECFITFESPDDAAGVIENSPHNVGKLSLDVTFLEEEDDDDEEEEEVLTNPDFAESDDQENITINVSGNLPSKEALSLYFENERRSGGGEVLNMECNDDGVVITFAEVKDLKKLLEGPHFIDNNAITVTKQPPKKKIPLDPLKVHVLGLSDTTTKDCLSFYLEKFSNKEVTEVYMGCNNNAMAVFDSEPDFMAFIDRVHKDRKGLEGKNIRLDRVPICSCIQVKGLRKETSRDTIELYFENNRKSGGGRVSHVEKIEKDEALVYFENPSSVETVIKRSHVLEEQNLDVRPHYPFLQYSTTNKTDVAFDAEVYDYIKKNHEQELQAVLDEEKIRVELSDDFNESSTMTIFPSEKKKDSPQSWKKRVAVLELFLEDFKKTEVSIPAELFDEIVRRRQDQIELNRKQGSFNCVVSFNARGRCAQIIGKKDSVREEEFRLQKLVDTAHKDTELMKSIVEVEMTDISKPRLALLKMCDFGDSLQNKHQHLTISIDLKSNKLHFKGPRSVLQEVQLAIYKFSSNVTEESLELSAKVIAVLKKPPVWEYMLDLLKQREIQALFVHDQKRSLNEVQLVGVGPESVRKAGRVIQNTILERCLQLTDENTLVLEGRKWKDFLLNLTSKNKIEISVDISSNTLWMCGIAEDFQSCFDGIKKFLDVNTIFHDILPTDQGTARFISEKWESKLDKIKEDFATCYADFRVASNFEGIEISGTAEGIEKSLPLLKELIDGVQKDSVTVEKPGMKKFISDDKGCRSLRAIENINNCVILTSERNELETSFTDLEDTSYNDDGSSGAKFMCSYLTKEGKKVSVFKGDITKHRVDAIVNAANSQLQHVGGVALAIVKAGGREIQSQCDEYVQVKGDLLEGRAMVTTAGALPCDKVIHTVGPRWDPGDNQETEEKKKKILNYAISNCLTEAETFRSIAIPAVSSGVFGGSRELCAEVILDAVLRFCAKNPSCALSEIHLVNNDDPTVKIFVEKMRKRFSGQNSFIDGVMPKIAVSRPVNDTESRRSRKKLLLSTRNIKITVKVGDLAQEKADVLVGTASEDLQLHKNPCARALSEAAGHTLQQQCSKIGPVAVGDIAVLNQTGNLNCQTVIFAACSSWNNGRGKQVLKGILKKCLQEADKKKLRSVAFAAIGTGVLQFPRDQVADLYFDEVTSYGQNNTNTNLKDVRFVLYDKDVQTIQAFQAAEVSRQGSGPSLTKKHVPLKSKRSSKTVSSSHDSMTFSTVRERSSNQLETTVGDLCFQVQSGDITQETTEAIAVVSNCDLDISASGTGAAILSSGGNSIKKECSRLGPQNPGSVVVTTAGNLRAKYLYHIVPAHDQTPDGIKSCLLQCLRKAENKNVSSISFPAIGTGNLGLSPKACVHTMLSAIQVLSTENPSSLKLIKMTIFQEDMMKDVRSAMEEASGVKPSQEPSGWRKGFIGKVVSFIGFGSSDKSTGNTDISKEVDSKKIWLEVVAGCKRDLEEALKAVNDLLKENSKQKRIDHKAIGSLDQKHMHRLHALELRYNVEITVEEEVERIVIDGQSDDILQVIDEIHQILHEVEKDEYERSHAQALSKHIQWRYKDPDNGRFEDYEDYLNAKIESAFQHKGKKAVVVVQDEMMNKYEIDFSAMTEKEKKTGAVTDVRRIDLSKDVEYPNYWVAQPTDFSGKEEKIHIFQLDPTTNSEEYKEVSAEFHKTCPNKIIKIERVQNPTLYGAYALNKQRMDKAGGRGSNEMSLFHGTKGDKCKLINDKGFNRSFCGENGTLYGNGVYFALQASLSARYSPQDSSRNKHMYLAKVLVGEYTAGKQNMLTPPAKNPNDITDTYDTVVDNVSNPGIFVVFYDWQCYPEYLITFQ